MRGYLLVMNKFINMKGKKAWLALKQDMEKAYDKVEWDFLFDALLKLGFHPNWIKLIITCISTVSYSVIVNNHVCGLFTPTRALRKGDSPLSLSFCYLHGGFN